MIRAAMLPLVAAALVAGCGDSEFDPRSDERASAEPGRRQAVEQTVEAYFGALAAGDSAAACRQVTESVGEEMKRRVRAPSCEAAIDAAFANVPPEVRKTLGETVVKNVEIAGSEARVSIRGGEFKSEGGPTPITLRHEDDRWLIAQLPPQGAARSTPYAGCVEGGVEAFEADSVDPFWKKQGRKDYVEFMRKVCRRAEREGLLRESSPDPEKLKAIAADVLREMVSRGDIPAPS